MASPSRSSRLNDPSQESSFSRAISNARLASPIRSPASGPRQSEASATPDFRPGNSRNPSLDALDIGPNASLAPPALSASHPSRNPIPSPGSRSRNASSDHGGNQAHTPDLSSGINPAAHGSPAPYEDFDIVRRHLAGPSDPDLTADGAIDHNESSKDTSDEARDTRDPTLPSNNSADLDDGFSSLRMQGGDMTREIYRRTEAEEAARKGKFQRSNSTSILRSEPVEEDLDYNTIRQPGGFRRNHLIRNAPSPGPSRDTHANRLGTGRAQQTSFMTRNFYEFLSLYGHFAGEELEDEDEASDASATQSRQTSRRRRPYRQGRDGSGDEEDPGEETPLLKRIARRSKRREDRGLKKGATGTVLILLKSFVGTGVLFLPKAFLNGGMLFSFVVLLLVAGLSYYCFLLLTTSRLHLQGSFAEMGEMTFGKRMRTLINTSLVISQIGFASAYIVFTSENLRAFILAVSDCKTYIDIKLMILMQLIIFLPLSLYRNLNNISIVVYIADLFIVLGLIYLYYYGISTLVDQGGIADIELFNSQSWTLFIGTAIFTFEGVGLIVPIQDGMRRPQQLPKVLGGVMIIITFIFISMGALAYAAYGSKTETVIILNMNQENKFVNGLQFIYSLAILLSTPMQIFPAITIMEKGLFTSSGKYSKGIKWQKNTFRFAVVMASSFIAWVGANDLDKFVALVGSFACIPLVYVYPPLIHYKAVADVTWSKMVDLTFCVLGFALMAYTSTITLISWGKGSAAPSPGYCDRR